MLFYLPNGTLGSEVARNSSLLILLREVYVQNQRAYIYFALAFSWLLPFRALSTPVALDVFASHDLQSQGESDGQAGK